MLAWFWCPDRKETAAKKAAAFVCWAFLPAPVQTPSLTLFLFLRGQDAETEKLFPHFHKLQKSAFPECKSAFVVRLSSHSYWTRKAFFFYPVVQSLHICCFLLVPSSEEFYYAWPLQQRRAVVTFSFATWLPETQRSVLYPLWGKWT